jgi:hypothetical protein
MMRTAVTTNGLFIFHTNGQYETKFMVKVLPDPLGEMPNQVYPVMSGWWRLSPDCKTLFLRKDKAGSGTAQENEHPIISLSNTRLEFHTAAAAAAAPASSSSDNKKNTSSTKPHYVLTARQQVETLIAHRWDVIDFKIKLPEGQEEYSSHMTKLFSEAKNGVHPTITFDRDTMRYALDLHQTEISWNDKNSKKCTVRLQHLAGQWSVSEDSKHLSITKNDGQGKAIPFAIKDLEWPYDSFSFTLGTVESTTFVLAKRYKNKFEYRQ